MIANNEASLSEINRSEWQPTSSGPGSEPEARDPFGTAGREHRSKSGRRIGWLGLWPLLVLCFGLSGCASASFPPSPRKFNFHQDSFAYSNQLAWIYSYDTNGQWT